MKNKGLYHCHWYRQPQLNRFFVSYREYSDGDEDGHSLSPALPNKKSKYV